jgi:hypothetical protein
MANDLMILELKNGKVYGGRLDEYYYNGGGVVALYYCKLLDKNNHEWIDHDIMVNRGGEIMRDTMPDFWIKDIKNIFVLSEEYIDKINLDDVLQIYIDPHYRPLVGIQCKWEPGENWEPPEVNHAPECDGLLHEALSFLYTESRRGFMSVSEDRRKDWERLRKKSLEYIRRRLLIYGAKIP